MRMSGGREGCGYRIVDQMWWEHRGEMILSVLGNPKGLLSFGG